jgi:hypothetical protein
MKSANIDSTTSMTKRLRLGRKTNLCGFKKI